MLVVLGFALFTAAQALGSFYLPGRITGVDLNNHSFGFSGDHTSATTPQRAAAIGLYFDESITFDLPDDPASVPSGTVLEITVGAMTGGSSSSPNSDFKLMLFDATGESQVLYQYYHTGGGYGSPEASDMVLIPLDGADTTRFKIRVFRIGDSIDNPTSFPVAYLGVVAATWVVGQVHADEQVMIVDLDPYVFSSSGSGDCPRSGVPSGIHSSLESFIRGADYYCKTRSQLQLCGIGLPLSDDVSALNAPVFLNINGIKEDGEYQEIRVWVQDPISGTKQVIKQIADYDSSESAPFSIQIPSEYLHAVTNESFGFAALLEEGYNVYTRNPSSASWYPHLPYSTIIAGWEGCIARFAKLQGMGSSARVVDLSLGDFTEFNGASKTSKTTNVDNIAMEMVHPYVLPWSDNSQGAFTFDAPVSDVPYFLEMVHGRLDSDSDLVFELRDNTTGEILSNATMKTYEDDMSSTAREFFYIPKLPDGKLTMSWSNSDSQGIYFSPYFVARFVELTKSPILVDLAHPGLTLPGSAMIAVAAMALNLLQS